MLCDICTLQGTEVKQKKDCRKSKSPSSLDIVSPVMWRNKNLQQLQVLKFPTAHSLRPPLTQICEESLPNLKSLAGTFVDLTNDASCIPKLMTTAPNLQHLEISLRDDWIHINFPMYRIGRMAKRKYD